MERITALLVDDEDRSIENLSTLLTQHCPEIEIISTSSHIEDAYVKIINLKPQVVFLDVNMPPFSGFDLLEKFEELPFQVVFVTAFDYYAIDAIKISALYYILKPIRIKELRTSVEKIVKTTNNLNYIDKVNYSSFFEDKNNPNKLIINTHTGKDMVLFDDIYYIESNNTYSTFYLKSDKKITSSRPIKEYEEILPNNQFFRCHRSYIVNISKVISIDKKEGDMLSLISNIRIPLASRRKEAFLSIWK
jgi:two-component system LytT family response regulator